MTPAQTKALQVITNYCERTHHDARMCYTVERLEAGVLLFCATNVYGDMKWYERTDDCYALIGVRGGVRQYSGSIKLRYKSK